MNEAELVDRARENRKSPATLKTRVSNLRSRYSEDPILVFEGVDDIGPYETWINSFVEGVFLKLLAGSGKEQVLGLRNMLREDKTGLAAEIFFFVDRDFDDLQGQSPGADLFCCDRYSVENYLVTELVVQSTLRDEFRLEPQSPEFDAAINMYRQAVASLVEALRPINLHLFCCRRLGVQLRNSVPELKKFVRVSVQGARLLADPTQLISEHLEPRESLPVERLPALQEEFTSFDPLMRYRGKFFFEFLRRWFDCVADEANSPTGALFQRKLPVRFSSVSMTMRTCASRSERPAGLRAFVASIYSRPREQ